MQYFKRNQQRWKKPGRKEIKYISFLGDLEFSLYTGRPCLLLDNLQQAPHPRSYSTSIPAWIGLMLVIHYELWIWDSCLMLSHARTAQAQQWKEISEKILLPSSFVKMLKNCLISDKEMIHSSVYRSVFPIKRTVYLFSCFFFLLDWHKILALLI